MFFFFLLQIAANINSRIKIPSIKSHIKSELKILNLNITKENIPDKISVKTDFKGNFGKNILKISEDGTIKQVILKMLTSIKIME